MPTLTFNSLLVFSSLSPQSNASAIYHILIPQDRTTYLHLFPPEVKARAVALWADPGMQEGWSHAKQAAIPEK